MHLDCPPHEIASAPNLAPAAHSGLPQAALEPALDSAADSDSVPDSDSESAPAPGSHLESDSTAVPYLHQHRPLSLLLRIVHRHPQLKKNLYSLQLDLQILIHIQHHLRNASQRNLTEHLRQSQLEVDAILDSVLDAEPVTGAHFVLRVPAYHAAVIDVEPVENCSECSDPSNIAPGY